MWKNDFVGFVLECVATFNCWHKLQRYNAIQYFFFSFLQKNEEGILRRPTVGLEDNGKKFVKMISNDTEIMIMHQFEKNKK